MKMIPCPQDGDDVILSSFESFPETSAKIVTSLGDPPIYDYAVENWQIILRWKDKEQDVDDTMNVRWDGEAKVWRDCE